MELKSIVKAKTEIIKENHKNFENCLSVICAHLFAIKSIVNDPRYGLTIVITHDQGYETVYSNLLTAEFVVVGEEVTQGQTIGTVGNTASFESSMSCHLHFELLQDGEYLDPTIYLK